MLMNLFCSYKCSYLLIIIAHRIIAHSIIALFRDPGCHVAVRRCTLSTTSHLDVRHAGQQKSILHDNARRYYHDEKSISFNWRTFGHWTHHWTLSCCGVALGGVHPLGISLLPFHDTWPTLHWLLYWWWDAHCSIPTTKVRCWCIVLELMWC